MSDKKKIEIVINGKAYPCRQTMGALLRFEHETGKDATQMNSDSISELCTLLWCCVVGACKSDGIEFNMSLMEFADNISPADVAKWATDSTKNEGGDADNEADGEKKS